MTNNNSENRLIPLAELTFMPMAFYILTQLNKVHTWQGMVLWFMVFALIQNEYLSVKNSFRHYNVKLYLLDLWSLFMYLFGLNALTINVPVIGYDPTFWIFLSLLWFGYAVWDFLMIPHEDDPNTKKDLKNFGKLMGLFFVFTLLCGLGISSAVAESTLPYNKNLIYILQVIPICCIFMHLFGGLKILALTHLG